MRLEFLLLMVFSVLISSVSQILLKKSSMKSHGKLIKEYLNGYVITGYFLLFCAMGITIYAYTAIPLKYGAVIETLSYAFVLILSALFLNEKITLRKVFGNLIIIAGVILFNVNF